jgi:hypothetical protein
VREIKIIMLITSILYNLIKKAWNTSCASADHDGGVGGGTLYYIQACKFLKL